MNDDDIIEIVRKAHTFESTEEKIIYVCGVYKDFYENDTGERPELLGVPPQTENLEAHKKFAIIINKILENDPTLNISKIEYDRIDQIAIDILGVESACQKMISNDRLSEFSSVVDGVINNLNIYRFTDGDLKIIQNIINSLRDILNNSEIFTKEHKERILIRLEKMQAELHKNMSNLDRFWGLMGEAGVALGKFGNDAKPFVDRVRELLQIVWNAQARSDELPTSSEFPDIKSLDKKS